MAKKKKKVKYCMKSKSFISNTAGCSSCKVAKICNAHFEEIWVDE